MSRARALRRVAERACDLSARRPAVVIGLAPGGGLVVASEGRQLGVVPSQHVADFTRRLSGLGCRVTRPIALGTQIGERASSLRELRDLVAAEVGS